MTKTLIFDTETTGLLLPRLASVTKQPSVIEFYGCVVDETSWQIVDEFETYVKPPVMITAEITKITGITTEDVAEAPVFADVANRIKTMIESADLAVAHNATFDRDVINNEMSRAGIAVNWPEIACTVEKTEHLRGHRLSLTVLHEMLFDEKFGNAHKAKADVLALLRCYRELKERSEI